MKNQKVLVIGGGPAGIMAAARARECGAEVVILEKGPKLGRKLRICGKGRGNVTNTAELNEFIEAFSPNGKFLYSAFSKYFREDLLQTLHNLGVDTKEERGGRVFPVSDKASDVADALIGWIESMGVKIKLNSRARSIIVLEDQVVAVEMYGGRIEADAVIIAAGGASYPKTGSTGDGFEMAKKLGIRVIPAKPALSGFVTNQKWVKKLAGLSLKNAQADLYFEPVGGVAEKKISSEFGEMLFTHTGVSGPMILTLSRGVHDLLNKGKVEVSIDLKPALTKEMLHQRLIRDFKEPRHFKNYLKDLLPRLLIDVFVELVGIEPDKNLNTITVDERGRVVDLLKAIRLTVKSLAPLDEAIVTAGGVAINEIDPKTMQSKKIKGLFFAGEVIDIDAKTGGYNLQAAFSTGFAAGEGAAEYLEGNVS